MTTANLNNLVSWAAKHKEENLFGRYITYNIIRPIIEKLPNIFFSEIAGLSFKNTPIHKISVGTGSIKILLWSQMHGNESTGTKAMFDLFKWLDNENKISKEILKNCTLVFIPILNPDGAEAYTRVNAQNIDLNRDAVDAKAPESELLQSILKDVHPKFCFNLHDQRTIFSIGNKPATISYLAPAEEASRQITEGRKVTMSVVSAMFKDIAQLIPGQIGRYTDEFYPTATGDNFQKAGYNTILIEAGHFQDDYEREEVRKYNFISLVSGIHYIATQKNYSNHEDYFNIPNNEKKYLDIVYKNIVLADQSILVDVGVLFKETLKNGKILFTPTIEIVGNLSDYNANTIIDKNVEIFDSKEALTNLFDN